MKKLLSLLSILTISGTAVPTTIAASNYEKKEKINSKFNYSQINNLEKLNRNKRECVSNAWSGTLGALTCAGENDPVGYKKFTKVVIKYMTVAACGAVGGIVSGGLASAGAAVACQVAADAID